MEWERATQSLSIFLAGSSILSDDNSSTIDMQNETPGVGGNFAESLSYCMVTGAVGVVGGGSIEFRCQESIDDTVWTDVPDNLVVGGQVLTGVGSTGIIIGPGDSSSGHRMASVSKLRYQRLRWEIIGVVAFTLIAAVACLSDMRRSPQATQSGAP